MISNVTTEENNAQFLELSCLRKKEMHPLSKGNTIRRTGIILSIYNILSQEKLDYKKHHYTNHHQQHITSNLATLNPADLAA